MHEPVSIIFACILSPREIKREQNIWQSKLFTFSFYLQQDRGGILIWTSSLMQSTQKLISLGLWLRFARQFGALQTFCFFGQHKYTQNVKIFALWEIKGKQKKKYWRLLRYNAIFNDLLCSSNAVKNQISGNNFV